MKIRSRTITWLVAALLVSIMRVLFFTLRKQYHIEDPRVVPYTPPEPEAYLIAVWHDSLLPPSFCGTGKYTAALVSRHQDGSYLAESLRLLKLLPVRGSTGRGGATAVRQLMTLAREKHIVMTPDGPRGPRRKLKTGIVFLASQTGRPIIPTAYSCRRCWRIRGNWTDLMIPKPFTTTYIVVGAPIYVPADQSREQLDCHTERVQEQMDRLQKIADRLAVSSHTVPQDVDRELRAAA